MGFAGVFGVAADTGKPSIPAREAIFAQAGPICYCSDGDRAGDDAVAIRLCFGATHLARFIFGCDLAGKALPMVVMTLTSGS
jgi:hypothetical protein